LRITPLSPSRINWNSKVRKRGASGVAKKKKLRSHQRRIEGRDRGWRSKVTSEEKTRVIFFDKIQK